MKINDPVTYIVYTDADAGWVSKVSRSGKMVEVEFAKQTLLNGPNSGEPDALDFTPGGFVGHVDGAQRWKIERSSNPMKAKFSLRNNGKWKAVGQPTKSPGCCLIPGHCPHYDFNF